MARCLIKDVTTQPLILLLFVYSKSEKDVYAYFEAHKVMFNQIYEVRTTYGLSLIFFSEKNYNF